VAQALDPVPHQAMASSIEAAKFINSAVAQKDIPKLPQFRHYRSPCAFNPG
jgi:hypothetical protein